jgi:ABC-type transporter Mla subunit MlaD
MALQDLTPQLRTRLHRVEWMVVLFLVVAVVSGAGLVVWFIRTTGEARGWWVTEVPYYTYVSQATGIHDGTPVQLMGYRVGRVTHVEPVNLDLRRSWDYYATNNFNVFVRFTIREPYPGYINTDSKVTIGGFPVEVAGGVTLDVSVGSPEALVTITNLPGGRLGVLWDQFAYKSPSADRTNKFLKYGAITNGAKGYYLALDQSETLLAQAQRIMGKVDRISGVIDATLPKATANLDEVLGHMARITAQLEPRLARDGGVGDLVMPVDTKTKLNLVLDSVTRKSEELTPILSQVNQTLGEARLRSQELGPVLVDVRKTLGDLRDTANGFNAKVNQTNLVENVSRLADKAARLSETTEILFRNFWLFRSAFRTNAASTSVPLRPSSGRDRRQP